MFVKKLNAALLSVLVFAIIGSAYAKQPTKKIACATSQSVVTEAEFSVGTPKTSIVNVTFVGGRPETKEIDRILRDCVGVMVKADPARDILGTAWFRPKAGDNPYDDEIIHTYGPLHYLSYQASTRTIEIRSIGLGGK